MNRADFMNQLESLLQSITATEREAAIQYYNDYFDDAGSENEQAVIEALGNPARVAENIKRDLFESVCAEKAARKVKASDRVIMEYDGGAQDTAGQQKAEDFRKVGGQEAGPGQNPRQSIITDSPVHVQNPNSSGQSGYASGGTSKSEKMPVWLIALVATIAIFAAPVLFGAVMSVLGTLFGAVVAWFALIFGFGVTALVLLLALVILVVTGIITFFANPWVGAALIGGGLLCGSVGLLFLMLTVAMAGIATPAILRGIAAVCKFLERCLQKGKRRFV